MKNDEFDPKIRDQILERAAFGYDELLEAARNARYCAHPIEFSTESPSDLQNRYQKTPSKFDFKFSFFKACGSRKFQICEACATVYRYDVQKLIKADFSCFVRELRMVNVEISTFLR